MMMMMMMMVMMMLMMMMMMMVMVMVVIEEFFAVSVGPAIPNRGSESAQPQLGAGGCHDHHNHDHDHYDCHGYRDHQGASVIVILEIPFHHDNQSHYIVHTSYITQS